MSDNAIDRPRDGGIRARPDLEFWRLCEQGLRPELGAFVASATIRDVRELTAVLRMDQLDRWPSGDRVQAEHYLQAYPSVRADAECSFELIYSEFLLREELGESPSSDEYDGRFPEHGARLRMQIELHLAIDDLTYDTGETARGKDTDSPTSLSDSRAEASESLPTIPGYEVLGLLGRGAMGIVYRARQSRLNRLVALKMVLAGEFAHSDHLARFRAEAEAAARLHHPNIVQIYDLGEHQGLPFLSLEYVEGGTLAELLAQGPIAPDGAARIIATLARAIEFAHWRGIVHRDLKPANILIPSTIEQGNGEHGSSPGVGPRQRQTASNAKIADFGLAKLVREGHPTQTDAGALLGTPNYMSPEQASGQVHKIGPAADIYALGAILYEMLAGQPPFHSPSIVETLQLILFSEPATLPRLQPRDLATICLKCLEKDRQKRYASAAELADDLERFLADQPIRARRVTLWEAGWRWRRRNPVLASLTAIVAALLVAVAGIAMLGSWRLAHQLALTTRAENGERSAKQDAQLKLWDSYLAEASARSLSHQVGQRFDALAAIDGAHVLLAEIGSTPDRIMRLRNAAIASLALPDFRFVNDLDAIQEECQGVSAPGTHGLVALNGTNGWTSVRRQPDLSEVARVKHGLEACLPPILSEHGRYLAIDSQKTTRVWRLENDRADLAFSLDGAHRPVFAPDERHLAIRDSDGTAQLYELATAKRVGQLGQGPVQGACAFHKATGRTAICGQGSIQVVDLATGGVLTELPQPHSEHPALAWHPNGKFLAATSKEGIVLWNVAEKKKVMTYAHAWHEMQLAFDGSGEYLFSYTSWDGWANLWRVGTGEQVFRLPNFVTWGMGRNAEGMLTLHRLRDGKLEVWQLDPARACSFLPLQRDESYRGFLSLSVGPDSRLLALGCEESFELWDLAGRERVADVPLRGGRIHFSNRGDLTVVTRETAVRWGRSDAVVPATPRLAASATTVSFKRPEHLKGVTSNYEIGASQDGEVLLLQTNQGWSIQHLGSPPRATFLEAPGDFRLPDVTADGRLAAIGGWGSNGAVVFAVDTGKLVKHLPVGAMCRARFSPDGRWLATSPNGVQLWRTHDWSSGPQIGASGSAAAGLRFNFSPDSRTLAVLQPDNAIRLFEAESGRELAALSEPRMAFASEPTFSPDGAMLLTFSNYDGGGVRIWDLGVLRRELAQRHLDWDQPPLPSRQEEEVVGPLIVNISSLKTKVSGTFSSP